MSEKEHVVLVDGNGEDLLSPDGSIKTMEKIQAHEQGLMHRAVSIFIFNHMHQLALQKRAGNKYHSPDKWSNTCCTHPRPGESPLRAARRRLLEEMGMACPIQEIFSFSYHAEFDNGLIENEFDHVFLGFSEMDPVPDPLEVSGWKWVSLDVLSEGIKANPHAYTFWFLRCFERVLLGLPAAPAFPCQP